MIRSGALINGPSLSRGTARGEILVLEAPLSFWGGMDPISGEVIDHRHPQCGERLTGKIVVLTAGRGSSSSSSVLAEAIRVGSAPAGLVLGERDGIIALGAIVAAELYGRECPVMCIDRDAYAKLRSGRQAEISADGQDAAIRLIPE
jgi:predicted aconitase with swiveling domain